MRWPDGFIAVDWGTTNRRTYVIDGDGRVVEHLEEDLGILAVPPGGFVDAIGNLRNRLGNRPLLLAGMVGSNRGWIEAPYVPCPASLADLVSAMLWVEKDRTAIVPGLSYVRGRHADVMRGEEVQILGAVGAEMIARDALVCHPGTHNKWVELRSGAIAAFRTVMTGELYNLLKEHSLLGELLGAPAAVDVAFERGVRHGLENEDLAAELFSVRARVLLGRDRGEDAASYISGLLVGNDLNIGFQFREADEVAVVGSPDLTRLYAAALAQVGVAVLEVGGEEAFVAGAKMLAERL